VSVRAGGGLHVCRGELRLARDAAQPLREVPLRPDPLSLFARVFDMLRSDLDEDATVAIDLLPASPQQRRRLRKRLLRQADRRGLAGRPARSNGGSSLGGILHDAARELGVDRGPRGGSPGNGRLRPVDLVSQRHELRQLSTKLLDVDAMFELQVLIRTRSRVPQRADAMFKGLLSAFEVFGADNEFTVSGINLFGADAPWRKGWFDLRFERGYFRPAGRRGGNIVNAREIAGLLKPPTRHCPDDNVVRAGPYLSPAPRDLPTYRQRPGVLPLGRVLRDGERVMVGMDTSEFFFGGVFGRSRFGKTELALVQLAHVAIVEAAGALFFDPHIDGIERLKPYLAGAGVRDRVVELNLGRRSLDAPHVGWNLLSMDGLGPERLADRSRAVVDSFMLAGGWSGKSHPRATAMLMNAVDSLLYLALRLPADLQPTIFTMRRLLTDAEWRSAAATRLPERLASYWEGYYANQPVDAPGPILNLVSRLEQVPTVRATFGSPQSTYDPRRAMDGSRIVLAAPPTVTDDLVASLIMQGHIDAARSRIDTPPDQRPIVYWWFDETQIYDKAVSSTRGTAVAEVLEQTAKYGVRAVPMAQSPHRMSDPTIEALTTNASFMITTATSPKGARFFADQWGSADAARAVQQLERWHYIAQPTHRGRRVDPFRLDGVPLEELWGEHRKPEQLDKLEAAINAACRPRTVRETLEMIEGHDDRILEALSGSAEDVPGRFQRPAAAPVAAPAGADEPAAAPRERQAGGSFTVRPVTPPPRRPKREPEQ
jgi:hypothetical protein